MTRQVRRWLRALLLFALWAATLPSATRATNSSTTCTLEGQNFMAFGNYDPMSNNPVDLQGRVSYRCSGSGSRASTSDTNHNGSYDDDDDDGDDDDDDGGSLIVHISISAGNAGGFNRYMRGPLDRLRYNLYLDPQRQSVWGDGTGGTRTYSEQAQSNNRVVTVPVYGRMFGAQDVSAGQYFDSLVVTLDF